MNIAISGWNGAGTSTLCLILAKNLKYKLLQGSQTFRYIGKMLAYEDTGIDRIKADEYLEDHWGKLYDTYVDYVLLNRDRTIIETDIAAFRLGKNPKFYSIFLTASKDERAKRLNIDKRTNDINVLEDRDNSLQKKYKELHNINWLSPDEIHEKYNLEIDNSNRSLSKELEIIYKNLQSAGLIESNLAADLIAKVESDEKLYWEKGKAWFVDFLKENNLLIPLEEIFSDVQSLYPERFSELPTQLKDIVKNV